MATEDADDSEDSELEGDSDDSDGGETTESGDPDREDETERTWSTSAEEDADSSDDGEEVANTSDSDDADANEDLDEPEDEDEIEDLDERDDGDEDESEDLNESEGRDESEDVAVSEEALSGDDEGPTPLSGDDEESSSALDGETATASELEGETAPEPSGHPVRVGVYTWRDFLQEHGYESDAEALYSRFEAAPGSDRWGEDDVGGQLTREDWERTEVDPEEYLLCHPVEIDDVVGQTGTIAGAFQSAFESFCDPSTTPVTKDVYLWEHYKREYYYEEDGSRPRTSDGSIEPFDRSEALGFDESVLENTLAAGGQAAAELAEVVDERTVDVNPELDEDEFFSTAHGTTTLVNRYDLEKAVPMEKKTHFREVERYWANKPYSFVIIFQSTKENETKYYAIQPHMNRIEDDLQEYLTGKLRTSIKYSEESVSGRTEEERKDVIADETYRLLDRYDLYSDGGGDDQLGNKVAEALGFDPDEGIGGKLVQALGYEPQGRTAGELEGISVRPEGQVLEEDPETLSEYQVEKLLYYLQRDFIGYERIDPIKYDINVEDISCDGYNSPIFVYHSDYEQIITNIYHGESELDEFVVKLAQRSGKGISKRSPQVDCTLPDGSRAQLTLGKEVSDHGTNYTIRQFQEVPHTPIDLINWTTFSLDEMAYLWLCIENHKSLIFAGGTASGKTTSLNAVSLFIPSNTKIVSIEDTREVELPQRNWIASVTRPSFSEDDKGDVDEFDLLEAALRQRPDYIVMGEVRGEEGRTLFQVMSTGHTTYTTFHADSVGEVLKRFTTDPINVSKTMFTALDLVSIQAATRVGGHKVKRNKSITEINHYDPENDEINVQDVFQWQAETDKFLQMGDSNTLEEIKFDRGWGQETLDDEMFKRRVVLAYLIKHGLNTYTQVAATLQAFINDPDTILALMANDQLERSLEDLREMESVHIDVDPAKEDMVPRPDPDEEGLAEAESILEEAQSLFDEYRGEIPGSVAEALIDVEPAGTVEAHPGEEHVALEETADAASELEGDVDEEIPALEGDGEQAGDETSHEPTADTTSSEPGDPASADTADAANVDDAGEPDVGVANGGTDHPADGGGSSATEPPADTGDSGSDDPFVIGEPEEDDIHFIGEVDPEEQDAEAGEDSSDEFGAFQPDVSDDPSSDDTDSEDAEDIDGKTDDSESDDADSGSEAEIDDWGFGEVTDDEEN